MLEVRAVPKGFYIKSPLKVQAKEFSKTIIRIAAAYYFYLESIVCFRHELYFCVSSWNPFFVFGHKFYFSAEVFVRSNAPFTVTLKCNEIVPNVS